MSTGTQWGRRGASVTRWHGPTLPCPPSFTICHKTEVVKNTLNPVWQPFTIPVRALCNGDYDRYRDGDGDRDGGSHGARAGYEQLFVGLAPQRQTAQNWVPIGIFSLLQPKLHKGIPLLSRAPTVTQISRSLPAEPQAGQTGWLCWKLVGQMLTMDWAVGLGVPKSEAGGTVPARLVAHPLYTFTFRTVKIDVYDWDRDGR